MRRRSLIQLDEPFSPALLTERLINATGIFRYAGAVWDGPTADRPALAGARGSGRRGGGDVSSHRSLTYSLALTFVFLLQVSLREGQ